MREKFYHYENRSALLRKPKRKRASRASTPPLRYGNRSANACSAFLCATVFVAPYISITKGVALRPCSGPCSKASKRALDGERPIAERKRAVSRAVTRNHASLSEHAVSRQAPPLCGRSPKPSGNRFETVSQPRGEDRKFSASGPDTGRPVKFSRRQNSDLKIWHTEIAPSRPQPAHEPRGSSDETLTV